VVGTKLGTLANTLMQLRKVCNHPFLLREDAGDDGKYTTDNTIIDYCGKMMTLLRLLKVLRKEKRKVLIFSQMTRVLDVLEDVLILQGWKDYYCRLDGSTSQDQRQSQITVSTDPLSISP
jgi:SNF2 family DNA or RNA helicase